MSNYFGITNNMPIQNESIKTIGEMIEALQVTNENLLSGKMNYYSSKLNKVLINSEKFFILNSRKKDGINNFDEFKTSFDNLVDTLAAFGNETKQKYFVKEKVMPDIDRKQEINNLIKNCYKQCDGKSNNEREF